MRQRAFIYFSDLNSSQNSFHFDPVRIQVVFFLSLKRATEIFGQSALLHFFSFLFIHCSLSWVWVYFFHSTKINKSPEAEQPCLRRCRQLPRPPPCQRCASCGAGREATARTRQGAANPASPQAQPCLPARNCCLLPLLPER